MVRMAGDDYPEDDDAPHEAHADPARARLRKTADAFRTISEVADELHVPQHVLRFWETKFPQVRPLKRGGGRRYYRPEDVRLLRRIADLLYTQGYTIKGCAAAAARRRRRIARGYSAASAEERMAAEAERSVAPAPDPVATKKSSTPHVIPELPMPGLLPEVDLADPARQTQPRTTRQKSDPETERLRTLLTETLHALEELRRLIG